MLSAQRQMERLDKGLVVIKNEEQNVFVNWRLFKEDPEDLAFNLYRKNGKYEVIKVNKEPVQMVTWFQDESFDPNEENTWFVKSLGGNKGSEEKGSFTIAALAPTKPFFSIPLTKPEGYTPNDLSVGDLDGDGQYEIIVHQVGRSRDNFQMGITDPPIFQAYKLDGTFLWEIN